MNDPKPPSLIALEHAIQVLSSQTALAAAVGKAQGHVSHWLKAGRVPAEYCPLIERATNGVVRCEQLRPDVAWDVVRRQAAVPEAGEGAHV